MTFECQLPSFKMERKDSNVTNGNQSFNGNIQYPANRKIQPTEITTIW